MLYDITLGLAKQQHSTYQGSCLYSGRALIPGGIYNKQTLKQLASSYKLTTDTHQELHAKAHVKSATRNTMATLKTQNTA